MMKTLNVENNPSEEASIFQAIYSVDIISLFLIKMLPPYRFYAALAANY
jgi:hypothetical protein